MRRERTQRAKVRAIVRGIHAEGAARGGLRAIVLTMKNFPIGELRAMGEAFDAALKRLIRTKVWKKRVAGGKLAFEVTGSVEKGWHLHANIIVEGTFWHQADLADAWRSATGGLGQSVWITALDNGNGEGHGINEAIKYFVKFDEAKQQWTREMRQEFRAWAKGRAFYRTYGRWRGEYEDLTLEQEMAVVTNEDGGCPLCKRAHGWERAPDGIQPRYLLPTLGYAEWGKPPPTAAPMPASVVGSSEPTDAVDLALIEEDLAFGREPRRRAKLECLADVEHAWIERGGRP
jgi:hypothetical protein